MSHSINHTYGRKAWSIFSDLYKIQIFFFIFSFLPVSTSSGCLGRWIEWHVSEKVPSLCGAPQKRSQRETALETVTGRSCSFATEEQALKSVRSPSSEQCWYRPEWTKLCQPPSDRASSRVSPEGSASDPSLLSSPATSCGQGDPGSSWPARASIPALSSRGSPPPAPQGTLPPLPAASESKPCEKLRESEDMPGGTAMTQEQMGDFSGTKCAHKKRILALKCIFTVPLSSLLRSPGSNVTYLAVFLFMSPAKELYI